MSDIVIKIPFDALFITDTYRNMGNLQWTFSFTFLGCVILPRSNLEHLLSYLPNPKSESYWIGQYVEKIYINTLYQEHICGQMRLYNIAWTWAIFIHFIQKVFIINYTSIKITLPKKTIEKNLLSISVYQALLEAIWIL